MSSRGPGPRFSWDKTVACRALTNGKNRGTLKRRWTAPKRRAVTAAGTRTNGSDELGWRSVRPRHPSPTTATVCMESRPRPRSTPSRVSRAASRLPWIQRLQRPHTPFPRISRQGQRTDKHVPALRGSRAQPASRVVSAASPAHRAPIQCARKTAKSRAPRHIASHSPGPLEGA